MQHPRSRRLTTSSWSRGHCCSERRCWELVAIAASKAKLEGVWLDGDAESDGIAFGESGTSKCRECRHYLTSCALNPKRLSPKNPLSPKSQKKQRPFTVNPKTLRPKPRLWVRFTDRSIRNMLPLAGTGPDLGRLEKKGVA